MRARILLSLMLVSLVACTQFDGNAGTDKEKTDLVAVARAVEPSLVRVEITLQYDKGQSPDVGRGVGSMGPREYAGYYGSDDYVREERPLEIPALLVAKDKVIFPDPMVHPRFIKSIAVASGDERVDAKPDAYLVGQPAIVLKLNKPLKNVEPLAFDKKAKPPYFNASYYRTDGTWTVFVSPFSTEGPTALTVTDKSFRAGVNAGLIVTKDGKGVGLWLNDEMPLDDSWKGSPMKQEMLSAADYRKLLDDVKTHTERGLPRVLLNFRSPKKSSSSFYDYRYSDDEGTATEQNTLGVLLDEKRVVVLANMQPSTTARLEKISVFPPGGGDPVQADFDCTLEDYGALVATLKKPMKGAIPLSDRDIIDEKDRLMIYADINLQGEQRISYFGRQRIVRYYVGRKDRVFPASRGSDAQVFIFDTKGRLVTIPLPFREKVASRYYGYGGYHGSAVPVAHLEKAFKDPKAYCDTSNVPLSEEEEARVAWMGVELQPLDKELARANKVSELTHDGETGAMVSYVYPGSPAAKAGVEPGDILLRLYVEGEPAPVEVRAQESYGGDFPWDRYSELPEQYFDRIPQPWSSAENIFTRMLTNLGIGKKYKAEIFRNGKVITKDFTIVLRPTHYDTAARFKSEALGITVRDLTMEVRRYFQRKPEDPGVIISKIEMGSKASVAGLKPYEIITQVNDKPIHNVGDFEKALVPGKEMRFSVLRMTQTRVVKITLPEKTDKKEEKP